MRATVHLPRKLRPPPGTDRTVYVEYLGQGFVMDEAVELCALRLLPIEEMRALAARACAGDETIPAARRDVIQRIVAKTAVRSSA